MRQLENVQNDIRRQRPDEVIKSDALPELRKNSTTGKTQVACTYDHDRAVLLQQAAESQMRHRHPGSLGKDLASQIARVFGTPIDLSRLPGFSPDGKRVVTAADDYTARIWDADSGKEIALLKGHTGGMQSAGFSPDGRRVVTASFDNTAHIWDVTWATLVRGDTLRERVCVEKLVGPAQEFTDVELEDPILRGINKDDSVAAIRAFGAGRCRSTIGRGCRYNSGARCVQMSLRTDLRSWRLAFSHRAISTGYGSILASPASAASRG